MPPALVPLKPEEKPAFLLVGALVGADSPRSGAAATTQVNLLTLKMRSVVPGAGKEGRHEPPGGEKRGSP